MKIRYYIFLFFLLLAVGCRQRTVMPLLEKAASLMNCSPDSSQLLLESIERPEELPIEEYATWCLLVTQARDKNYVEHTSDSVFDIAVRYFVGQEDPHRKAHAYYCKGRVLSDLALENVEALASGESQVKLQFINGESQPCMNCPEINASYCNC